MLNLYIASVVFCVAFFTWWSISDKSATTTDKVCAAVATVTPILNTMILVILIVVCFKFRKT